MRLVEEHVLRDCEYSLRTSVHIHLDLFHYVFDRERVLLPVCRAAKGAASSAPSRDLHRAICRCVLDKRNLASIWLGRVVVLLNGLVVQHVPYNGHEIFLALSME